MIFLCIFMFIMHFNCEPSQDIALFENCTHTLDEISYDEDNSLSKPLFLFVSNPFSFFSCVYLKEKLERAMLSGSLWREVRFFLLQSQSYAFYTFFTFVFLGWRNTGWRMPGSIGSPSYRYQFEPGSGICTAGFQYHGHTAGLHFVYCKDMVLCTL